MGFSEFWLNSNKKLTKSDFEKTISKEKFADNESALSLFLNLDLNNDNKLDKNELGLFFDKIAKFANKDDNAELSAEEAQDAINDMVNFLNPAKSLFKEDLKKVTSEDLINFVKNISESADEEAQINFMHSMQVNKAKTIMPKNPPDEAETKEFTIQNLRAVHEIISSMANQSDKDISAELNKIGFKLTDLLIVPFAVRQYNRLDKKEEHNSYALNLNNILEAQEKCLYFLEKASSKEGLTFQEYYGFKKECLKSAVIAAGWNANDPELDKRVESVSIENIDSLLKGTADDPQALIEIFKEGTEITSTTSLRGSDGQFSISMDTKISPSKYSEVNLEELVPFEKVFKDVRGIEYNQDNIQHFLAAESVLYYSNLDNENKQIYENEAASAFIRAFGQPENAVYSAIYNDKTRSDNKLKTVTIDENNNVLSVSNQINGKTGTTYVVPERDLLAKPVPLDEKQLQKFSTDILFNMISIANQIIHQYYQACKDNLFDGNATWQDFKILGNLFSGGNVETIHKEMEKLDTLYLEALQMKQTNNPDTFKKLFEKITGSTLDFEKIQNLAALVQMGEGSDSEAFKQSLKDIFGENIGSIVETTSDSVASQQSKGGITGIVQMLVVTQGLGELAIFKNLASASMATLGELGGSMVAGAMNLGAYEFLAESGNVIGRSVYNDRTPTEADLLGIVEHTAQGMAFGAAGAVVQKFIVNPVMKKIDPNIETRAFSKVEKMLKTGAPVSGSEILKTVQSASPLLAAQAAGFVAEVAGFTGYTVLEKAFLDVINGRVKLPDTDNPLEIAKSFIEYLGVTFDEQFENLGTIKGLGQLLMFMRGGKASAAGFSQRMKDSGLDGVTIKERALSDGTKSFLMTYKDGSRVEVSSINEVVGRLNAQLFGRDINLMVQELTDKLNSLETQIPDLNTIDKFPRNEDINQANYNPSSMRKKASAKEVQNQVSKYLDYLLEQNPEISGYESNVKIDFEIMYHKDYFLPDGTCISLVINSVGKEVKWNEAKQTHEVDFFENPDIVFWIRDTNGKEHVLPSISKENIAKAKNILTYLTTLESVDSRNIVSAQNEILAQKAKPEVTLKPEIDRAVAEIQANFDEATCTKIVAELETLGFGNTENMTHRAKSYQSLFDKIKNYLIDNPGATIESAVKSVRDGFGARTVVESGNFAQKTRGTMEERINQAIEMQSQALYDAIIRNIDELAAKGNGLSMIRMSNYATADGKFAYLTRTQYEKIRDYAIERGIDFSGNEIIEASDPKSGAVIPFKEYEGGVTKTQPSGYPAFQMNFKTKDGKTIEFQFRGDRINTFAEGEHIPYDLRTGKDIIGQHPELEPLYGPIRDLLKGGGMPEESIKEYNRYWQDYYIHLRKLELGFESTEPKLEDYGNGFKFDKRLEAKNLVYLHELGEKVKKGEIKPEEAVNKFNKISSAQRIEISKPLSKTTTIDFQSLELVSNSPVAEFNPSNLDAKSLVLVHMTQFEPQNGTIQSRRDAIRDGNAGAARNSVHFTLNHAVEAHRLGDWSECPYAIIMPFENARNANVSGKFIEGMPNDLYTNGSVKIPEGAIIIKYNPDITKGQVQISDYPNSGGIKILETSESVYDLVKPVIEKMGFEYSDTKGNESSVFNIGKCSTRTQFLERLNSHCQGWLDFCRKENIQPAEHSYSSNGIAERIIEGVDQLATTNSWKCADFKKDYKQIFIEWLTELETNVKNGDFVSFDVSKLKQIIQNSAFPRQALRKIKSELNIIPSTHRSKKIFWPFSQRNEYRDNLMLWFNSPEIHRQNMKFYHSPEIDTDYLLEQNKYYLRSYPDC